MSVAKIVTSCSRYDMLGVKQTLFLIISPHQHDRFHQTNLIFPVPIYSVAGRLNEPVVVYFTFHLFCGSGLCGIHN